MTETYDWICPKCNETLGELNGWCEYCRANDNIYVYNPDRYYIRDVRIYHLTEGTAKPMTPQEELFSELFNHEKKLVCDMDTLTLRAHREELAKIAFEARARLTAVDDEDESRKKRKTAEGKPTGFERSLNTDDTATNAINAIKDRQKRLTKSERVQEGLKKLYELSGAINPEKESNRVMSAQAIILEVQKKVEEAKQIKESAQPVFNPFAKKENE